MRSVIELLLGSKRVDRSHNTQVDEMDCGPTCLRNIASYFGCHYSIEEIRQFVCYTRVGVSLEALVQGAEKMGLVSKAYRLSFDDLLSRQGGPFIAHWRGNHFVTVLEVRADSVLMSDPLAHDVQTLARGEFLRFWAKGGDVGVAVYMTPGVGFEKKERRQNVGDPTRRLIASIVKQYRKDFTWIGVLSMVVVVLEVALPIQVRFMIDFAILGAYPEFLFLLLSQFVTIFSRIAFENARNRAAAEVSSFINLKLLMSFFDRLLSMPILEMQKRSQGDIIGRINAHDKIREFFGRTAINFILSSVSILSALIFLMIFSYIYALFLMLCIVIYVIWIRFFSAELLRLKYFQVSERSRVRSDEIQLTEGYLDIRVASAKNFFLDEMQVQQKILMDLEVKISQVRELQRVGALAVAGIAFVVITAFNAWALGGGQLTFGQFAAISLAVGLATTPLVNLVDLFNQYYDIEIGFRRALEFGPDVAEEFGEPDVIGIPNDEPLNIDGVGFSYPGSIDQQLKDVSFSINPGSRLAIVGPTGSGKSTLLHIMMNVIGPTVGAVTIGNMELNQFGEHSCEYVGACAQDGYLFAKSIKDNIILGRKVPDAEGALLRRVISVVELDDFILSLPQGIDTVVGDFGRPISGGQKQRILLARALFRDPQYLFLDEATSSLDPNTERDIMRNLSRESKGMTLVLVTHRLSMVSEFDRIVVMGGGSVEGSGTHEELLLNCPAYRTLVLKD